MPAKGEYSDKYSPFNRTSLGFGNGAAPPAWQHGSLTTDGVAGAQPRTYDKFTHKGQYEQPSLSKVFTEAGMQPKEFTPKNPRNVPDFNLNISDIEATGPESKDWYYHTPRGTNPLDPHYKLPSAKEQPLPVPKFIRDSIDVSDIDGTKAKPDTRAQRELSSLVTTDIQGAKLGWKPAHQHLPSGRDSLSVGDICINNPSPQQRHQQLVGSSGPGAALAQQGSPRAEAAACFASLTSGGQGCGRARPAELTGAARVGDVGVIQSVDWRRQQYEAMREQGEARKQRRAEADTTLDSRAPQIASTSALSALLKGFRAFDKDRSGWLQAGEFAAVLQHASLGLSHDEVSKLVGGLCDTNNLVEYKTLMGKLFTKAQRTKQQQAQQAQRGCSLRSAPSHLSGTHQPGPHHKSRHAPTAAEELQLPNWAAARQRRLSTAVALTLNQQPSATAAEAASVASPQHWQLRSPRRFSMHKPDPAAVNRSGGVRLQPGSPGAGGDLREVLLLEEGSGKSRASPGRSRGSVSFHSPTYVTHEGLGRSMPGSLGGCARTSTSTDDDPLFATEPTRPTAATPKSSSWSGPLTRGSTPGSPTYLPLPGTTSRAKTAGCAHGEGGTRSAGISPSRLATAPARGLATTSEAPGLLGTKWGSQQAATESRTAAASSPRILPLLPHPTAMESVHFCGTEFATERRVAAEHASSQRLQEEIAMVHSLS